MATCAPLQDGMRVMVGVFIFVLLNQLVSQKIDGEHAESVAQALSWYVRTPAKHQGASSLAYHKGGLGLRAWSRRRLLISSGFAQERHYHGRHREPTAGKGGADGGAALRGHDPRQAASRVSMGVCMSALHGGAR